MKILDAVQTVVNERKMLNHPFYRDWMQGLLSKEQLQNYAQQYRPFVDAFPRFVSGTHSRCDSEEGRKLLLDNLMDEEGHREGYGHSAPHPKLWRDFARGIGSDLNGGYDQHALALKNTFLNLCHSSYEEGLCALYAYECQIPEIAEAKIQGLKEHYQIDDETITRFFAVHQVADVYHTRAIAELIQQIPAEKAEVSLAAAQKAVESLWAFLSSVHHPEVHAA